VHGQIVGSGVEELLKAGIGVVDHEVDIDGARGCPEQGADDGRLEAKAGHKAAVRYVDVEGIRAASLCISHLLGKATEIRAEN
jgi:hypothetical protein